ncbi:MAG: hypothetical protein KGJ23_02720 [Euryarchaeota archaeon]|nr:hypothetical protein [Euryarchaeota archaeon]MDE1835511.1 hypothetical protein [Euryarchaeota archaeon]MDE1879602.1 hypothetical protein [Euryarchaeota archaeon]MDE2043867.1 hypothetical protein [Thermoplasmata archaeon]
MNVAALVSGSWDLASAGIYAVLAWTLSRRQVSAASRVANTQFAVWWGALSASTLIGSLESLYAAFAAPGLDVAASALLLTVAVICVALWGLVGYLIFVFTGRYHLLPLTLVYVVYYVLLSSFVTARLVDYVATNGAAGAVSVVDGSVSLNFITTGGGAALDLLLAFLLLPEIVGAVLYLTLYRRTTDRTVRFRILMVGGGLLGWLGSSSILALVGASGSLAGLVFTRTTGVVAALAILMAFRPPEWVRTRFDLNPPALEVGA